MAATQEGDLPGSEEFYRGQVVDFVRQGEEIKGLVKFADRSIFAPDTDFQLIGADDDADLVYSGHAHVPNLQGRFTAIFKLQSSAPLLLTNLSINPERISAERPFAMQLSRCARREEDLEWETFIEEVAEVPDLQIVAVALRLAVRKTVYRGSIAGDLEKYISPPPTRTDQLILIQNHRSLEAQQICGAMMLNVNPDFSLRYKAVQPESGDFELIGHTLTEMRNRLRPQPSS